MILEWPQQEVPLFIGMGTHEERYAALKILRDSSARYVLDLVTIAELHQRNALSAFVSMVGRPLVPHTVRARLLSLLQLTESPRGAAWMTEIEGKLQMTEVPSAYFEARSAVLQAMLHFVDTQCDAVPVVGPEEITDLHRGLARALDLDTLDVLYLCLEREAVLLSEDGGLRALGTSLGLVAALGVQPVLMEALARGVLQQNRYAEIVAEKILAGHDFVCVRGEDLHELALSEHKSARQYLSAALNALRKPTLDIVSGIGVACGFLQTIVSKLPTKTVFSLAQQVTDVLLDNRDELAFEIHRAVAESLLFGIRRLPTQQKTIALQTLNPLLRPAVSRPPRLKATARAALLAFRLAGFPHVQV